MVVLGLLTASGSSVQAQDKGQGQLEAASTATVLSSGPRGGSNGARYFNIQGKANTQYAGFGVLDFPIPADKAAIDQANRLALTLTQSLARFSKDGKVKFYLVADLKVPYRDLKFDADTADGLGNQFETRFPLGAGEFKKEKTGTENVYALTLDEAARTALKDQVKSAERIRIVVVPDGEEVAATFFGAGSEKAEQKPRLAIVP
jgi:hypothetical protein